MNNKLQPTNLSNESKANDEKEDVPESNKVNFSANLIRIVAIL